MSRELATALMMLAAAGWIVAAGGWFVQSAGDLVRRGLTLTAADVADFAPAEALMRNGVEILLPLASLFALALGAAVAGPAMLGSMGWRGKARSEEHTSELQSLMRLSYAVFCLKK